MEQKINNFFKNIDHILNDEKRVNVLYLTTRCNLKCDYCYESTCRSNLDKDTTLTYDQVVNFFEEIEDREKGLNSTLVIMGGEPFLVPSLLIKTIEYLKFESKHKWGVCLTTNGTLLHKWKCKYISDFIYPTENTHITLEVSYDGSGHDRRIWGLNGLSSKKIVQQNMLYLKRCNIPFRISYTVHKDNYNYLLYDIIYILENYSPKEIKLSLACQELNEVNVDYKILRNEFIPYANEIYKRYNVPICDLSCGLCGKCDKTGFVGNRYFSPTKGLIEQDMKTIKQFDGF